MWKHYYHNESFLTRCWKIQVREQPGWLFLHSDNIRYTHAQINYLHCMQVCLCVCVVPASLQNPEDETLTLSKGEDKRLDCRVSNDPYPPIENIFWKHNGNYFASGTSLLLRGSDQNETGDYECTVFNGHGIPVSKRFDVSIATVRPCKLDHPPTLVSISE